MTNQVDAYEQEVGILEKTLEQLKAHQWGMTDDAGALTEALSMDRGQQVYGFDEKCSFWGVIVPLSLTHHLSHTCTHTLF